MPEKLALSPDQITGSGPAARVANREISLLMFLLWRYSLANAF